MPDSSSYVKKNCLTSQVLAGFLAGRKSLIFQAAKKN